MTGAHSATLTYDPLGRLFRIVSGASVASVSFAYDSNGNLTSDGSNTYGYDAENRLISTSGAHSATLIYDPLGRLFEIDSGGAQTQFLYDGDELVAEYNALTGVLLRRYVHGPGVDDPLIWYEGATVSAATRRSLQQDYQGTIVSVADSSGNALNINTYDEYGVPGSSNAGRFQYTGQAWLPEVGLYYYKARIYAPALGRFLQTDLIGYASDVNLYAYVGNDPIDRSDPTGQGDNFCGLACAFLDVRGPDLTLGSAPPRDRREIRRRQRVFSLRLGFFQSDILRAPDERIFHHGSPPPAPNGSRLPVIHGGADVAGAMGFGLTGGLGAFLDLRTGQYGIYERGGGAVGEGGSANLTGGATTSMDALQGQSVSHNKSWGLWGITVSGNKSGASLEGTYGPNGGTVTTTPTTIVQSAGWIDFYNLFCGLCGM
ncbi:MAG: RHS repeat-associated core domain-containing protein [Terricaulis silvestris]